MDKKGQWWVATIWISYKENGIELASFTNLYWDNRNDKMRELKAKMDNEKQINKMHKQIFYPLKFNNEHKTHTIYRREC